MMKLAILLVIGVIARHAHGDEPEAIIGGNVATKCQFPYQVSLQYIPGRGHNCGGTLISPRHILTAAHCVDNLGDDKALKVKTGCLLWKEDGELHDIKVIHIHPGYTGSPDDGYKDDIAIITLTKPITVNSCQYPIPVASRNYATGQYRGVISGWGITKLNTNVASPILKWTGVNVLSKDACCAAHPKSPYGGTFTTENQICTLEARGHGACSGDSGGPLVINGEVCGIASWVAYCALGIPDVYTNVYRYLDFINESVNMY